MIDYGPPGCWPTPARHPDWRDAGTELEHLRALGLAVIERFPSLEVGLDLPEPGLMYLVIGRDGITWAEVYSVQRGTAGRQYGVFGLPNSPLGEEFYCHSASEIVAALGGQVEGS